MGYHRSTVYIEAPPEEVWKVLTNAERRPEWEDAIVEVRDVTGPMDRVGTRWVEVRSERGKTFPATMEVTRVEAPRLIEWTGPLPAGARLLFRVTLEPRNGGTQKRVDAESKLPLGPVGKLLDRLVVQRMWTRWAEEHGTRSDEKLKTLVESEHTRAASS
jgi:uncharacterized protein YndB with AHSA1/START domain